MADVFGGAGMGTEAGSIGDSFMDAPVIRTGNKGKGGGGGDGGNPISDLLAAVGVHIGESKQQANALNKGTTLPPSNVTGTAPSQTPNPATPPTQASDGTVTAPASMPVTPVNIAAPNVPAPSPISSFFSDLKSDFLGTSAPGNSSGANGGTTGLDYQPKGQSGSFGKTLMKIFGAIAG